ncbi:hypothetical protein PG984_002688 [Apiospora sp. TS-2023a]
MPSATEDFSSFPVCPVYTTFETGNTAPNDLQRLGTATGERLWLPLRTGSTTGYRLEQEYRNRSSSAAGYSLHNLDTTRDTKRDEALRTPGHEREKSAVKVVGRKVVCIFHVSHTGTPKPAHGLDSTIVRRDRHLRAVLQPRARLAARGMAVRGPPVGAIGTTYSFYGAHNSP